MAQGIVVTCPCLRPTASLARDPRLRGSSSHLPSPFPAMTPSSAGPGGSPPSALTPGPGVGAGRRGCELRTGSLRHRVLRRHREDRGSVDGARGPQLAPGRMKAYEPATGSDSGKGDLDGTVTSQTHARHPAKEHRINREAPGGQAPDNGNVNRRTQVAKGTRDLGAQLGRPRDPISGKAKQRARHTQALRVRAAQSAAARCRPRGRSTHGEAPEAGVTVRSAKAWPHVVPTARLRTRKAHPTSPRAQCSPEQSAAKAPTSHLKGQWAALDHGQLPRPVATCPWHLALLSPPSPSPAPRQLPGLHDPFHSAWLPVWAVCGLSTWLRATLSCLMLAGPAVGPCVVASGPPTAPGTASIPSGLVPQVSRCHTVPGVPLSLPAVPLEAGLVQSPAGSVLDLLSGTNREGVKRCVLLVCPQAACLASPLPR